MSKMLEQAIIDAKALKEAALKNAEAEIVEKYAPEVKKVMESILEAEEDELDLGDEEPLPADPTAMGEPEAVEDPTAMGLPLGATAGEKACACPDEHEPVDVVLDLPGLAALVSDTEPAIDAEEGELEPTELAMDNAAPLEEELPLEEDELAAVVAELLGEQEETLEENETVEEVSLEEDCGSPEKEEVYEEKQPIAESADLAKIAGKTNELLETIKALQEQNDNFKADNNKMVSGMKEQKEAIQKLATTLEELSLQNAKLLYTNEVLKADSLNERQKQIAVEALRETKSVEHAKTVFDTLQSTVVSTKRQGRPESLSEVVSNNTSMKMPRRKETKNVNPHESRWKLLAGIK